MGKNIITSDMQEIYKTNCDWSKLDSSTILLTGPYGMLASYIVYYICYLVEQEGLNIKLVTVGRSKEKFYKRFNDINIANKSFVTFIENDLESEIYIDGEVDYIIHAASLASPQYYAVCPVEVLKPNVVGNFYLLKLAVEKRVKGYLLFSTGDVYGRVDNTSTITETDYGVMDTLDIHNCYSESKRMAETMCKAFFVQYNLPVKLARIWHTYSPTMDIENDPRVFSSFVKNIVHGQDIEMKSDGSGKRCFCYITDAISGYFKILLDGVPGEAYNVCNEEQYISMLDLAKKLVQLCPGKNIRIVQKKREQDEKYTENILLKGKEVRPSSEKLRKLGWNFQIDIEEGFSRVIQHVVSCTIE